MVASNVPFRVWAPYRVPIVAKLNLGQKSAGLLLVLLLSAVAAGQQYNVVVPFERVGSVSSWKWEARVVTGEPVDSCTIWMKKRAGTAASFTVNGVNTSWLGTVYQDLPGGLGRYYWVGTYGNPTNSNIWLIESLGGEATPYIYESALIQFAGGAFVETGGATGLESPDAFEEELDGDYEDAERMDHAAYETEIDSELDGLYEEGGLMDTLGVAAGEPSTATPGGHVTYQVPGVGNNITWRVGGYYTGTELFGTLPAQWRPGTWTLIASEYEYWRLWFRNCVWGLLMVMASRKVLRILVVA